MREKPVSMQPSSQAHAPALLFVELQDELMMVASDLDRLDRLLDRASRDILLHFEQLAARGLATAGAGVRKTAMTQEVVTSLQFQDLSSQLIAHAQRQLKHCVDRLAAAVFPDEGDGIVEQAPGRPNPVCQSNLSAGSVELF